MRILYLMLGSLSLLLLATGCSQATKTPRIDDASTGLQTGFDPSNLDPAIRPQDDFYAHVNRRWIESTEIPPEWTSYGTMQIVYERTERQLKNIVQIAAAHEAADGSNSRKIGDLYKSFMDVKRTNQLGLLPIEPELARIDALQNYDDLIRYFGHALADGITVPVNFYIDADAAQPERALAYLWQDGLGLPDRDYYLSDSQQLTDVRRQYRAHISKMFKLAGWDADGKAEAIFEIERQLAEKQWSRVQNRDREKIYSNKYSIETANSLSPGFDWKTFLDAGEFGDPDRFVIAQTDYFAALGQIVRSIPVADWRDYLRFQTLRAYAPYLNHAIVTEDFDFRRRILRGQKQIKPRWKRGIRLVSESLGDAVGQIYVERYFPPESRQRIETMIGNLREAFARSIDSLEWMTPETKRAARQKLALFNAKIGYPDQWKDYSTLEIATDDLVGNIRRIHEFQHREEVEKITKPIDRNEWDMTPQTVNAYYRATLNEIVFPAAILQPPFFDSAADDAFNYGAIGSIIGHEFSHGFDDQGRKFDGRGRLANWWTERDAIEYEARADKLVEQFNAFKPLPDQAVNGRLTLGENIADLAGLTLAFRAWRILIGDSKSPVIDGYSGTQRFFIGFATIWRAKIRDKQLRELLLSDPHSPPKYRVIGTLRNMPEFLDAFDVTAGDGMYVPVEQRVRIW